MRPLAARRVRVEADGTERGRLAQASIANLDEWISGHSCFPTSRTFLVCPNRTAGECKIAPSPSERKSDPAMPVLLSAPGASNRRRGRACRCGWSAGTPHPDQDTICTFRRENKAEGQRTAGQSRAGRQACPAKKLCRRWNKTPWADPPARLSRRLSRGSWNSATILLHIGPGFGFISALVNETA
jgi:hypothetical protein